MTDDFRHGKTYLDHREDPRVQPRKDSASAPNEPRIYLQDSDFTLYNGDALEVLRTLPDESVHMCVTRPPFYGLRDYGTGTWEGGDAECDHVAKPAVFGRNGERIVRLLARIVEELRLRSD